MSKVEISNGALTGVLCGVSELERLGNTVYIGNTVSDAFQCAVNGIRTHLGSPELRL